MTKDRGVYKRGNTWCIRFAVNGREVREAVGPSRKLAVEVRAKRLLEVAEGRYFPERTARRRMTVGEAIDEHLKRTEQTHKDHRHRLIYARWWKKKLGPKALNEVRPGHVEAAVRSLRTGGARPATVNRYLAFLKRTYTLAVGDGHAEQNPVLRVKLAKEPPGRVRWLTDDECPRLRGACEYENGHSCDGSIAWAYIELAMNTGLRQSEQWRLTWADVGIDGQQLHVRKSKSGEPRWVPLNATARAALDDLRHYHGDPPAPTDRICHGDATHFVKSVFKPALERAGIEGFRWHDLRHTFASRLVMAGVPLHTVQTLLGHKTIVTTMRYAHLSPGHLREAVERIEGESSQVQKQVHSLPSSFINDYIDAIERAGIRANSER